MSMLQLDQAMAEARALSFSEPDVTVMVMLERKAHYGTYHIVKRYLEPAPRTLEPLYWLGGFRNGVWDNTWIRQNEEKPMVEIVR